MSRGGGKIVFTKNEITPRLNAMPSAIRMGIAAEFARQAPRVQSYAQRNAPWTNRTGNARNGLKAIYVGDRNVERSAIRITHGVYYGIFLETKYAGKYAIIRPTVISEGDRIMAEMRGFLGRIGVSVTFTPGESSMGMSL